AARASCAAPARATGGAAPAYWPPYCVVDGTSSPLAVRQAPATNCRVKAGDSGAVIRLCVLLPVLPLLVFPCPLVRRGTLTVTLWSRHSPLPVLPVTRSGTMVTDARVLGSAHSTGVPIGPWLARVSVASSPARSLSWR